MAAGEEDVEAVVAHCAWNVDVCGGVYVVDNRYSIYKYKYACVCESNPLHVCM